MLSTPPPLDPPDTSFNQLDIYEPRNQLGPALVHDSEVNMGCGCFAHPNSPSKENYSSLVLAAYCAPTGQQTNMTKETNLVLSKQTDAEDDLEADQRIPSELENKMTENNQYNTFGSCALKMGKEDDKLVWKVAAL